MCETNVRVVQVCRIERRAQLHTLSAVCVCVCAWNTRCVLLKPLLKPLFMPLSCVGCVESRLRGEVQRVEERFLCASIIHAVSFELVDFGKWSFFATSSAISTLETCFKHMV